MAERDDHFHFHFLTRLGVSSMRKMIIPFLANWRRILIIEDSPERLRIMSDRPSDIKLELKDVVVAVREVTEWYDLGLQLGLPDYVLKVIASHPNVEEHQRMMLSKWLESDPSASWEKLAAALYTIGKKVSAENVRRQFLGLLPVQSGDVVEQDAEQRLAMTETILRKIKSRFSLLLIKVQSSLEDRKASVRTVRQFLLHFFEGECSIPDTADLGRIFESISTSKLWRYDHYGPLEELAESFLPDEDSARTQITEYKTQLSGFQATTRIIDFVKLSEMEDAEEDNKLFSPKKYNRYYRKISFKLKLKKGDISELTLDYIDQLWKMLLKEFDLPPLTAVLDKIIEGSLTVTWLVLPHVLKKIRDSFSKSVSFFQQKNIISIELYGGILLLYDESWMEHSSPLYQASFAGNTEQVVALVEGGAVVNQQNNNDYGDTPLNGACRNGHLSTALVLLEHGAIVDSVNKAGESALMLASGYGHGDLVKLLLKHGAKVDIEDYDGLTALMYASAAGEADTVRVLLDHGAVVDLKDNDGLTALMYASAAGEADTVRVLLDHGAVVDLKDNYGRTALMWASDKGEADTVRVLLDHGTVVHLKDNDGRTALMYASGRGEADTVRVLLDHGAVVDLRDNVGKTSLWYASSEGESETVEVLVKFGAQVDIPADDYEGSTALSIACENGHSETARILLDHSAAVDYQDKKGQSPLVLACIGGHTETVKVLLESKLVQVDLQNDEGWSALFFAAKLNHVEIAQMLVAHGAAVDIRSKTGLTAFDVATAESNMAVCEVLTQYVSQGVKLDTQQPVEERETDGQHQRTESESHQQERKSESQQQGGTELTEEQRAEVRSVGERIWEQFKRIFLTELVRKEELTSQHQGEGTSHHIIDHPKGRRSLLNRLNIFSRFGGQRRQRRRQVVGKAPAPE